MKNMSLPQALIFSLIGHVLFIGIFFLFGMLDLFDQKLEEVQVVSVQVDVLGMPEYTLQELKRWDQLRHKIPVTETKTDKIEDIPLDTSTKSQDKNKEEVKQEEVKEEVTEETKNEDSKNEEEKEEVANDDDFLDFAKNLGKTAPAKNKKNTLRDTTVSTNKKSAISNNQKQELKKLILAGNQLSQGPAAFGEANATQVQLEWSNYLGVLPAHIRPQWQLPQYLKETQDSQQLKCRIRLFIHGNGRFIKAQIYESSGVQEYDQLALLAVQRSAPYPSAPELLHDGLKNGQIILGFPL